MSGVQVPEIPLSSAKIYYDNEIFTEDFSEIKDFLSSLDFLKLQTETYSIVLTNKQKSQLQKKIDLSLKRYEQTHKVVLSDYINDTQRKLIIDKETFSFKSQKSLKIYDLIQIFQTSLVSTLNNFQNLKHDFELLKSEYSQDLKETSYLTEKKLFEYYFKEDKHIYDKLVHHKNLLSFTKENILWSTAFFSLFLDTHSYSYLDSSVKYLQSCRQYFMRFTGDSKFTSSTSPYFSNGRFCSFTQTKKSKDLLFQITNSLKYYESLGYTHSFLTLAPKNIQNLTKDDFSSLCDVLKEFWRHPIISKVFKGYYGVEECVENLQGQKYYNKSLKEWVSHDSDNFNEHFHFLCLRKKSFEEGYIQQKVLSQVFQSVCNKFGNNKIKNSFRVDIRAPHIYDTDKTQGSAKYILQYLAKGVKMQSLEGRKTYIKATDGMRKYRAGGLLANRYLKDIPTLQEFNSAFDKYDLLTKTYSSHASKEVANNLEVTQLPQSFSLGGKYIETKTKIIEVSKPILLDTNQYGLFKLFGYSREQILKHYAFSMFDSSSKGLRKLFGNSLIFEQVRNSLFSKKKFICPFTGQSLSYVGISSHYFFSDISSSYFQYLALEPHFLSSKLELTPIFEKVSKELSRDIPSKYDDWSQVQRDINSISLGVAL